MIVFRIQTHQFSIWMDAGERNTKEHAEKYANRLRANGRVARVLELFYCNICPATCINTKHYEEEKTKILKG